MPEVLVQRILAPVDFSDSSSGSLDYARALAGKLAAQLHVLHVLEDPSGFARKAESWAVLPQMKKRLHLEAQEKLEALELGDAILEVRWGEPFLEILDYARERAIDLIVMGSHGHGTVKHLLLGSVAEKVLRTAACPVLTVRDPQHRYVTP